MDLMLTIVCVCQSIEMMWALPYPVFGTKRYHRANVISPEIQQMAAPMPMYQNVPQYYDATSYEPSYAAPPYPGDESTYYYYPHHSQHNPRSSYRTYGMPTYHGEYKPQPYYYAHGPTYSYYDDHIDTGNPLDDLHEEMLQEDERERQREIMPIAQEQWIDPVRQSDSIANVNAAFLRNLIAYNQQMNTELDTPEMTEEFDDYMNDEVYDEPQYYENPQELQQPRQKQFHPQQPQSPHQHINHVDQTNEQQNFHQQQYQQYQQHQTQDTNSKINEIEDDDVRALKNLAIKSHKQESPQQNHHNIQQQSTFPQYDTESDYDEDSWINWDKKRSIPSKKDQSIFTFSDRKPHYEKQNDAPLSTPSPSSSITATTTSRPTTSAKPTLVKSTIAKTTHLPIMQNYKLVSSTPDELVAALKSLPGQKEVVLPRPATPVRHPFSAPIMAAVVKASAVSTEDDKRATKDSVYDTIKQLLALEHHHGKVGF